MAETQLLNRNREEGLDIYEGAKRHKSYTSPTNNNQQQSLLSFLDEEEEEVSTQDLSSFLTTLRQELSDPLPCPDPELDPTHKTLESYSSDCSPSPSTWVVPREVEEENDEKDRVIRHLLEASDDELGIPNRVENSGDSEDYFHGFIDDVNNHNPILSVSDGLWELEDEAANYYTLLQSQLFM